MTDFEGCYLTTAGLELSAKSGVNIVFTRAETGSGVYTSPEGVKDLVGLKHKQYDHELEDVEIKGELADVIFYVTNKGVTEEYKLTEIGIYARAEGNEEILYCIAFAYEENAETIDAETAGQITYCRKFCIETKISADANVAVQIVGTDHEWAANYFIKYAGQVDLEAGTLQEQIKNHTHKAMTGATETQSGRGGFVPKPDAGQQSMALFGDGKFKRIEDEINTEYDEPENMEKLTSGEKFKNLLGKLSKAVSVIFEKLDVSRVVNNNITTESGFALDARQANPTIEGTMANQILQLNNDFLKTNHIGSDNIATFADFYTNQESVFLVIVSDGNNALNKEIFGFDSDDYNNGFGCVILSVKILDWRGFALAIPINMWGVGCYIGQINGDARKFSWTKISMT